MSHNPHKNRQEVGRLGEQELVAHVPCPNCGRKLMPLPKNYPMCDVQCTACNFRAQVKTNSVDPKNKKEIFGATWEIMNKVMKAGYLVPALFVLFNWNENGEKRSELRFYPFVPKGHLKPRRTHIKKTNRNLVMFNYRDIHLIPYYVYNKGEWEKA